MSAKQALVPLFVRIPTALKKRVKDSATAKGTSLSKEVGRLLLERLESSQPADFKLQSKELEASMYKGQLEAMEAMVLACAANKDAAGSKQLSHLGELVLEMRHQRQQTAQDIQRRRDEQEAFLARPTHRVARPFTPLLQPDYARNIQQELERSEGLEDSEGWRLNLLEELKSRPRGSKARLAADLGCTRGYISQILSEPSAAGHRNINKEFARRLESALQLKKFSLNWKEPKSDIAAILQATAELGKVVRKTKRLKRQ